MVESGSRLAPPPGCPRALYSIMMSCWYVGIVKFCFVMHTNDAYFRHPKTSLRPKFAAIGQQLSVPDAELLKWTEEDKSTHPKVDELGADLLCAQDLYKDLQEMYRRDTT